MTPLKPADYIWIARWGQAMGSLRYYIYDEQCRAANDNAPLGAIYKDHDDGHRHTIDEIDNPGTRAYMKRRYSDCPW